MKYERMGDMKKKILSISLVVSILAVFLVGASLAYLTDEDEAVNTFTVGKVDIELTEPAWDAESASNKIVPTVPIPKDPTITFGEDSEPSYLKATITFNGFSEFKELYGVNGLKELHKYILFNEDNKTFLRDGVVGRIDTQEGDNEFSGTTWANVDFVVKASANKTNNTFSYDFYFQTPYEAEDVIYLFKEVVPPSVIADGTDEENLAEVKWLSDELGLITVKAYAIQTSSEFNDVYEAFTAFDAQ